MKCRIADDETNWRSTDAERLEVIAMEDVELSVMVTGVADCAEIALKKH